MAACSALGQTYTISTFAGGGLPVNVPSTSASPGNISGVAADAAGNVFVALSEYSMIVELDAATGVVTQVAGSGTAGFSGDNGPATSARLNFFDYSIGITLDSAGNLYIADILNDRIRKVSNGVITTVAGNGNPGLSGDNGPAVTAQVYYPGAVAIDSLGNLYIVDGSSHPKSLEWRNHHSCRQRN
jgi:hypothetical protein